MAKDKNKGLGKGLGALFGSDVSLDALTHPSMEKSVSATEAADPDKANESADGTLMTLSVEKIKENPWQPRQDFDEDALLDLTESIREKGVLSPLIVTERDGQILLVAGERRLRAAKQAGLSEVPAIMRAFSDEDMAQIALIENIQRTDLNIIEEATGYAALIKNYHYTQQQLADLMGKSRPYIANVLRLLDLPEPVMKALQEGKISAGHARALLAVKDPELAAGLCSDVIAQDLSVRALERTIQDIQNFSDNLDKTDKKTSKKNDTARYRALCDQLGERLQTKVQVSGSGKRSHLVIDFYSEEDLTRILDVLGIELY